MGKLFATSAVLILAAGIPAPHAEEFPWCVEMDVFTKNCAFASYNDCVAIAKNAAAICIRNPNFHPDAAAATNPKAAPGKASNRQR
jgi:hypothetical protein